MKRTLFEHTNGNQFKLRETYKKTRITEIDFATPGNNSGDVNSDAERFVGKFFILVDGQPYGAPDKIRPFTTQVDAETYAMFIINHQKIDPKRIEIKVMR